MDWTIFYNGWVPVARVVITALVGYAALIALLRIGGKRTLAKMNAFDFVVTIAIGSILASMLLNQTVALAEGMAALGMLVGMQYAVAWLSVRFKPVNRTVKSTPTILLWKGEILRDVCRDERVAEGEVRSAVRSQGLASLDAALAVVLESTGDLSVVERPADEKSKREFTALKGTTNNPGDD